MVVAWFVSHSCTAHIIRPLVNVQTWSAKLIPLQGADFLEKQLANVFELDEKTVNDYLDCNNIGFDCTMLYIKNRVEEAGISLVLIDVVLGVSMYGLTLQILYLVVSYPYKYTLVC